MAHLVDKLAVVTGATGGVGSKICEELVKHGLRVAGLGRRQHKLDALTAKLGDKFLAIKCDLSQEDEILSSFQLIDEKCGGVHTMINCAGVLFSNAILESKTEDLRNTLDINVLAPAICTREAVKSMRKYNIKGHIINMNSAAGHNAEVIKAPVGLYCASKYAVTGMTASLKNELFNTGIKITSISPTGIATDMIRRAGVPDNLIPHIAILYPQDVADAVIYSLRQPDHVLVSIQHYNVSHATLDPITRELALVRCTRMQVHQQLATTRTNQLDRKKATRRTFEAIDPASLAPVDIRRIQYLICIYYTSVGCSGQFQRIRVIKAI
ncbi:unnamed protein product [Trichogramma brassicae]|uniref:Uncharacterized protein n=1 Tax=Trichogramma brassicae TaxID=86971 RepID=A0A6H5IHK3_9HYME|nr:unnamed protein product [Trichogramma brassicae]